MRKRDRVTVQTLYYATKDSTSGSWQPRTGLAVVVFVSGVILAYTDYIACLESCQSQVKMEMLAAAR